MLIKKKHVNINTPIHLHIHRLYTLISRAKHFDVGCDLQMHAHTHTHSDTEKKQLNVSWSQNGNSIFNFKTAYFFDTYAHRLCHTVKIMHDKEMTCFHNIFFLWRILQWLVLITVHPFLRLKIQRQTGQFVLIGAFPVDFFNFGALAFRISCEAMSKLSHEEWIITIKAMLFLF